MLKDYRQNQELVMNLGNRYYQVIYPIQIGHRPQAGLNTREINSGGYGKVSFFKPTNV